MLSDILGNLWYISAVDLVSIPFIDQGSVLTLSYFAHVLQFQCFSWGHCADHASWIHVEVAFDSSHVHMGRIGAVSVGLTFVFLVIFQRNCTLEESIVVFISDVSTEWIRLLFFIQMRQILEATWWSHWLLSWGAWESAQWLPTFTCLSRFRTEPTSSVHLAGRSASFDFWQL